MYSCLLSRLLYLTLFISNFVFWENVISPVAIAKERLPRSIVQGAASWYGGIFEGRLTANGEVFHENNFSAAHKTLRLGTVIRVENLKNGKQVLVRVNDRGPYVKQRIIDLSVRAARNLDIITTGVARIAFTIVSDAKSHPLNPAYAFFIRLTTTDSFTSMQSDVTTITTVLGRPVYTLFSPPPHKLFNICIGPFSSFVEAQDVATKIEPQHSIIDIVLAPKKGGVLPFTPLLTAKNKKSKNK